jgi:NAD-dependent dihydropyrimidine dehydrogenase PreA subunit
MEEDANGFEPVFMVPNVPTPNNPVVFDPDACSGCNRCVEICTMGILMPHPEKGKPPIVLYPEECWYSACCVAECPNRDKGAIRLVQPIMQRVRWKRKETGEHFRIGMKNPPPPNTRPPAGGWP